MKSFLLTLWLLWSLTLLVKSTVAFTPQFRLLHPTQHKDAGTTRLAMVGDPSLALRKGIKVPLLDIPDPVEGTRPEQHQPLVVMPLPSDHLPDELRDLNVYGMELSRPVHKLIMEDAIARAGSLPGTSDKPLYGHLAWKPEDDSLVGAIGCVSEIILHADGDSTSALMGGGVDQGTALEAEAQGKDLPKTIVSSGAFRFIVKEVVQSVPFPIVVVDELPDVEPGSNTEPTATTNDEYDDNDDVFANLSPPEMMKELFKALQTYIDQKVEEASNQQISPLEQSILEETGAGADPVSVEITQAEQMAATLLVFRTGILDIAPRPMEGYFAIAFLAAEIVELSNAVRRKMLTMTDGAERLRFVLREVSDAAGMAQARKMANKITDSKDESEKDLKVGIPELPPWSRQITKGTRVSYYWNEEYEWCDAEVIEDPVKVLDELLITLKFEDGEVHRLPLEPDEKARWKPA